MLRKSYFCDFLLMLHINFDVLRKKNGGKKKEKKEKNVWYFSENKPLGQYLTLTLFLLKNIKKNNNNK